MTLICVFKNSRLHLSKGVDKSYKNFTTTRLVDYLHVLKYWPLIG